MICMMLNACSCGFYRMIISTLVIVLISAGAAFASVNCVTRGKLIIAIHTLSSYVMIQTLVCIYLEILGLHQF